MTADKFRFHSYGEYNIRSDDAEVGTDNSTVTLKDVSANTDDMTATFTYDEGTSTWSTTDTMPTGGEGTLKFANASDATEGEWKLTVGELLGEPDENDTATVYFAFWA